MSSMGGAQMSSDMLSQLLNMQSGNSTRGASGASDAATSMINSLDTNGDGVVSLEEAEAGGSQNASQAFAALDSDGDGSLTSTELSSALQQLGPPHGYHHGGPRSSSDIATQILSDIDSDGDGGLSLSEIGTATGTAANDQTNAAFSNLDTDGNGKLSLTELTSALDKYLQTDRAASQAAQAA